MTVFIFFSQLINNVTKRVVICTLTVIHIYSLHSFYKFLQFHVTGHWWCRQERESEIAAV